MTYPSTVVKNNFTLLWESWEEFCNYVKSLTEALIPSRKLFQIPQNTVKFNSSSFVNRRHFRDKHQWRKK